MPARKLVIGLGLSLFCAVASSPRAASAQSQSAGAGYPPACTAASVASTESEKAHAIYAAGKVQYDDANYDAAITQFRDAYKRDCSKHELLVIISRSYELKGDRAEAIRALQLYIEREHPADEATHKTHIENLKKQLAAQPAPAPAAGAAAVSPQETREHSIPPWILVGVGGAAVVTGIVLIAAAPSLPDGCSKSTSTCNQLPGKSSSDFSDRQARAGNSVHLPNIGLGAVIGGVVVGAGGLLWHFLEPTGLATAASSTTRPKLTPQVAPGFAGASFGGTF